MQIVVTGNPHLAAEAHFRVAHEFYETHGQEDSAIAHLTAGLLALSRQVQRIELASMDAMSC